MDVQNLRPSIKIIKDLEVSRVNPETNHDRVSWKIKNISSLVTSRANIQSPIFVVGTADDCKWYLELQIFSRPVAATIPFTCYLILHHESDCKETFVKYNFHFPGSDLFPRRRSFDLSSGQIYTFITKSESEKKAGIFSSFRSNLPEDTLIVKCEMMIQSVVPEIGDLSSNLESLFKNQLLSDVVLSVGGKNFPAHKAILAARSSVFAAMFTNDMAEKEGDAVRIEDIDENVIEEMLRYIYTGKLTLKSRPFAKELLKAADKYDMKELVTKSEYILVENLSCSDALDLLAFAKIIGREELKSKVISIILDDKMKIMETEAWKNLHQTDSMLLQEICEACILSKN